MEKLYEWNLPDIYLKDKRKIKLKKFRISCLEVLLKIWKGSQQNTRALVIVLIKLLTSNLQLY